MATGYVGSREDPRHHGAEHQGHHGCRERHREGVEHDLRVLQKAAEIVDAVGGRWPNLRVTDIEGGLQQKVNRIQDEHRGNRRNSISGYFLDRGRGPHRSHKRPPSQAEHAVPFLQEHRALRRVLIPIGRIEQLEIAELHTSCHRRSVGAH